MKASAVVLIKTVIHMPSKKSGSSFVGIPVQNLQHGVDERKKSTLNSKSMTAALSVKNNL